MNEEGAWPLHRTTKKLLIRISALRKWHFYAFIKIRVWQMFSFLCRWWFHQVTWTQHTPAPSQSSPNPPSSFKAHEMCKMETRNPHSQIWDWLLLWRATCTLRVAVLMTTFKFPEEQVPYRKGKFICSCQWSVFWAAGMAWQQGQQCLLPPHR